ncbi:hypothetical protein I6B53_09275 [Schaalia sp. 19OD2882]|uniref:hypothetical protein n=1 Tax=Schaalia sp. 19OD2882 TaxID=2794089 RepID=UPI001C1F1BAD|nr:hypothetical protein [Schaalia sp. 19OD2882]QWW19279.1 hypothetical protein I6B53_09275 [Schaalia sp. 19OD2882]
MIPWWRKPSEEVAPPLTEERLKALLGSADPQVQVEHTEAGTVFLLHLGGHDYDIVLGPQGRLAMVRSVLGEEGFTTIPEGREFLRRQAVEHQWPLIGIRKAPQIGPDAEVLELQCWQVATGGMSDTQFYMLVNDWISQVGRVRDAFVDLLRSNARAAARREGE